ncbi:hypothetical protein HHX47_DHR2000699 [Lentinula edodes]|nr:hypothetical protein HHX47_DHR2000699 [Lentinula edodes]
MIIAPRAASTGIRVHLKRRLSSRASGILSALNIPLNKELSGVYDGQWKGSGEVIESVCPTTGEVLARIRTDNFTAAPDVPAPRRGEILRQIRERLANKREELGALVTLEMGKIRSEGVGEVQEFIDIWLDRNLALSLAAGNATIWKPSPTTPLTSIAVTSIIAEVLSKNNLPGALAGLVTGGQPVGEVLVGSKEVELVSFTGSERVGRIVGQAVVSRFGKSILELGGNNGQHPELMNTLFLKLSRAVLASIVMPDADLSLAVPGVFFGAVGTAGQRCTSTRRLFLHRDIAPEFLQRLQKLYASLKPGDPLDDNTLLGPLHTPAAVNLYESTVEYLRSIDADILFGGKGYEMTPYDGGNFVQPTIAVPKSVEMSDRIWSTETFAPILNVAIFDELEEAIRWNNAVPQGLSSSLWTRDLRNVGKWTGPSGSDAGIVNVSALTCYLSHIYLTDGIPLRQFPIG